MSAVTQHHADELARGADEPGVALDADKQRQLLAYLALLIKWNKAYNLTAVARPGRDGFAPPARQPEHRALCRGWG